MIIMPRTKVIQEEKTEEIVSLEQRLKEAKEKNRKMRHTKKAQETLEQIERDYSELGDGLEEIYNKAKDIFFKVNGARRVLKQD